MSSKFPYIDVAVSMADGENPASTFLTEGAPSVELPALSGVAAHFDKLDDGYLIWPAGQKRAFTYFVLDNDGRTTLLSATMLVDRDVLLSGRPIVNFIKALKSHLYEGDELTSDNVDEMLTTAGFVADPLRSQYDAWGNPTSGGVCCRVYSTPAELISILGFPRQKTYDHYRGVLIVPASATMIPGEELPLITQPVDKALMVVCPPGVTASAEAVNFSDHLKVTYTCEGFDPVQVMFEVGTTNRYVRINGPALIVNSAAHAGIVFRRRVQYSVVSLGGGKVDTYTILINGRTASRSETGFEVTNIDFESGDVTIVVSSTNYSTYSQTFTPESLEKATPLTIVLEPESMDILLRLDFGDGRVVEENVNIEKNTTEHNQLRAGWFHGFRAHRVMGATPETYNVDVRLTQEPNMPAHVSEPVLPFDEPVVAVEDPVAEADPVGAETPVAPEYINVAVEDDRDSKPEKKKKAPKFTNMTIGGSNAAEEDDKPDYSKYLGYVKYVVVFLVFCLIVWGVSKIVGGCGSDNAGAAGADSLTTDSVSQHPDSLSAATNPAGGVAAPAESEAESADVEYLNTNKLWRKDRLRSEKYKALFTAFESGDIDAIVNNDYFAVGGRAKNREAVKAIDNVWKTKGTPQEKAQRKLLASLSGKGMINIHKLYEEVARKMPKASDQNKTSRPKR